MNGPLYTGSAFGMSSVGIIVCSHDTETDTRDQQNWVPMNSMEVFILHRDKNQHRFSSGSTLIYQHLCLSQCLAVSTHHNNGIQSNFHCTVHRNSWCELTLKIQCCKYSPSAKKILLQKVHGISRFFHSIVYLYFSHDIKSHGLLHTSHHNKNRGISSTCISKECNMYRSRVLSNDHNLLQRHVQWRI